MTGDRSHPFDEVIHIPDRQGSFTEDNRYNATVTFMTYLNNTR